MKIKSNEIAYMKYPAIDYPEETPFNPPSACPEYPFKETDSGGANKVYGALRELLFSLGLDHENYGKKEWNPFKDIIKPGNSVLIKPNMVLDQHGYGPDWDIFSVITHPSLVRAVCDYVIIALKGKGKITIGDAPLQSCNFNNLIKKYGYLSIKEFYASRGVDVDLLDFRLFKSEKVDRLYRPVERKDESDNYIAVDLGQDSLLNEIAESYLNYRVTNYDPSKMERHHNREKNEYLIPRAVLNADVIIDMPKPKPHRKAGITCAMKNFVGINGHKDWLPHHRSGCKSDLSDEYLYSNFFKKIRTRMQETIDVLCLGDKIAAAKLVRVLKLPVNIMMKLTSKDRYVEGSWWGNDTIWRTVCDLNRIALYADKNGVMKPSACRKIFILADMITSGDEEGPLEPTPKKVGALAAGFDLLLFDTLISAVMGFDYKKIPNIIKAYEIKKYPITSHSPADISIISNTALNGLKLSGINADAGEKFRPTKGWEGHIELDK